jgi:glutathionylspermidine synthase
MDRVRHAPRPDFAARAEAMGFRFATIEGEPYWTEDAHYVLSDAEVDRIEAATTEIEAMCLDAVDALVREGRYEGYALSDDARALVETSWTMRHRQIYGRMDLTLAPDGTPKLLEYNADTPTALFEAAVVQWEWLQCHAPDADQFNSLHEGLVEAWKAYGLRRVHVAAVGPDVPGHAEDGGTADYMAETAHQAGVEAVRIHLGEIGWNGADFTDLQERPIEALWKLYPWEWMVREPFGRNVRRSRTLVLEPAWRMLLSDKAILPHLWRRNRNHPNLLPAAFAPAEIADAGPLVSKPACGREGAGVLLPGQDGPADPGLGDAEASAGRRIWQAFCPLPSFGGLHPVLGSWTVAGRPRGLGVREDASLVTTNASRFVPHLIR